MSDVTDSLKDAIAGMKNVPGLRFIIDESGRVARGSFADKSLQMILESSPEGISLRGELCGAAIGMVFTKMDPGSTPLFFQTWFADATGRWPAIARIARNSMRSNSAKVPMRSMSTPDRLSLQDQDNPQVLITARSRDHRRPAGRAPVDVAVEYTNL